MGGKIKWYKYNLLSMCGNGKTFLRMAGKMLFMYVW